MFKLVLDKIYTNCINNLANSPDKARPALNSEVAGIAGMAGDLIMPKLLPS